MNKTTNARAQTASSNARTSAIKVTSAQNEARRNYKPPPSAGKKLEKKETAKAEKMHTVEQ